MPVEFHRDDPGYQLWRAGHPNGYVLNVRPKDSLSGRGKLARLHRADCSSITRTSGAATSAKLHPYTDQYCKVCDDDREVLERWTAEKRPHATLTFCANCNTGRR